MRWRWGRRVASPAPVVPVVIWSRAGCHLCHELEEQVRSVVARDGLAVDLQVRDVDDPEHADPALRERLNELVPVLVVDGAEVGHWRLTDAQVRSALRRN